MRYLENVYEMYKEQKKNPLPEIENLPEVDKEKIKKKFNEFQKNIKKEEKIEKPDLEFGEVYYFISDRGIPIFFMVNGELEGSKQNLYSVYKVSDFVDFATKDDFIFNLNDLPYMVETWNEFYIPLEQIKKAVYIGKLSDEDVDVLLKVLDEGAEIPQEKRGLTILEEGNYIQNLFKQDEVEDVAEYKVNIFGYFEDLKKTFEDTIIELPPERLKEQPLVAGEEKTVYRGENFILFYNKEKREIELEPSEDLINKSVAIKIFDEEFGFRNLPEEVKLKIPEEYKGGINIDYIGKNIELEEIEL